MKEHETFDHLEKEEKVLLDELKKTEEQLKKSELLTEEDEF